MKELAINRSLDEETRAQSVWVMIDGKVEVFSMHITEKDEVIITDHSDYTKIYAVYSLDYFNALERSQM